MANISEDPGVKDLLMGNLDKIFYGDESAYLRLMHMTNGNPDPMFVQRLVDVLSAERVYDSVPPRLKLKDGKGMESGCRVTFRKVYSSLENPDEITGNIYLSDKAKLVTDIAVLNVVKALEITSLSKVEELATACREVITAIIKIGLDGSLISVNKVLDLAENPNSAKGYYQKELYTGIKEVLERRA